MHRIAARFVLQVIGHLLAVGVQEGRELRRRVQQHQRARRHAVERLEAPQAVGAERRCLGPGAVGEAGLAVDRRGGGGRGVEVVRTALGIVVHGGLAAVHVHLAQGPLQGDLELRAVQRLQLGPLDLMQQGHSGRFRVEGHGHGQWPRARCALSPLRAEGSAAERPPRRRTKPAVRGSAAHVPPRSEFWPCPGSRPVGWKPGAQTRSSAARRQRAQGTPGLQESPTLSTDLPRSYALQRYWKPARGCCLALTLV